MESEWSFFRLSNLVRRDVRSERKSFTRLAVLELQGKEREAERRMAVEGNGGVIGTCMLSLVLPG